MCGTDVDNDDDDDDYDGTDKSSIELGPSIQMKCCTQYTCKALHSALDSIESNDKRTQINFAYKTTVFLNEFALTLKCALQQQHTSTPTRTDTKRDP